MKNRVVRKTIVKSAELSPLYLVILLCLLMLQEGCISLSASSGGLQKRMEIEQLFESGTLLPDHTYYIDGSEVEPDAIIAISNTFQLQTNFWSQRDLTVKELKSAVFWMQTAEVGFCEAEGGVLIAPDGQQIGAWYSQKDIGTVRQPSPGVVEVFPFMYSPGSPCNRRERLDMR
jgi:hypothetical protein